MLDGTGFFLVFSGMLVGYMLWYCLCYRDRREDDAARNALESENEDLRTSIKLAHNSHEQLDERFNRQKNQLNVLQQLCDDWSSSREQTERDRVQLEVEVADKTRRLDEAVAELQSEKQLRIELEDENHKLVQSQIEKVGDLQDHWRKQYTKVESTLVHRQSDLKSAVGENERLTQQLHAAEAKLAELNAELASQRSLLETATRNASGLEQEYVSVESALEESSALLKQSRSECAVALSSQRVAQESLNALQTSFEAAQSEVEALHGQLADRESLQQQLVSLQQSFEQNAEQLTKVTEQRDLALAAEKSAMTRAHGLQNRIDNQEGTIHGIREKRDDALENLKRALQERNAAEQVFEEKLEQQAAELAELTSELERRSGDFSTRFEQARSEFQNRIALQSETILQLTTKRDAYKAELDESTLAFGHVRNELQTELAAQNEALSILNREKTSLHDQLEQTRIELQSATKEVDQARQQREELNTQIGELQSTCQKVTEMEQLVLLREQELDETKLRSREMTTKIEELKTTCQRISELEKLVQRRDQEEKQVVDELRMLRRQYAESYQKQQDLQRELEDSLAAQSEMDADHDRTRQQIPPLQTKLKASEETIRTLRRERAAVLARLANYRTIAEPDATVISFTEAMAQRKQESLDYDDEYGGSTDQHPVRGLVYTEPPKSTDDLKLISGIAEVLEARLNDFGIYTFKQIMEWSPTAIEEFSRLLTFRDRILRDDWIGQARFFYEQKRSTDRSVAA